MGIAWTKRYSKLMSVEEEFSRWFGGIAISEMEINVSMLENVVELMMRLKLETMTVKQLFLHLCDIKLKTSSSTSDKSHPTENTAESQNFSPSLLAMKEANPWQIRNASLEPSVNFDIGLNDNVGKKRRTLRKLFSQEANQPETVENKASVGGVSELCSGQSTGSPPYNIAASKASVSLDSSSGNPSSEEMPVTKNQEVPFLATCSSDSGVAGDVKVDMNNRNTAVTTPGQAFTTANSPFLFHSGIKPSTHKKWLTPKKSNFAPKISANFSAFGAAAKPVSSLSPTRNHLQSQDIVESFETLSPFLPSALSSQQHVPTKIPNVNIALNPQTVQETTLRPEPHLKVGQVPKSQPVVAPPLPPPTHPSDSDVTAEFYRKQGKEFYSVSEDYEKSLECFTRCLESAPDNWSSRPVVLGNRAAVLFMLERFVESAADCKQAVDEDASLRKLNIRRGKSLLRLGQLDEAEETLSELLNDVDVDEDSRVEARSLLGTASSMKLKVTQLSTAELSGTHSVVMSKADEILQQCPAHRAALLSKVRTSCAMKNWAAAKTFIDVNILNLPESTLRMSCHPLAEFPAPSARDLSIDVKKTAAKTNTRLSAAAVGTVQQLQINIPAIVRALLCLGSPMARLYVCLLKNVDANRVCCADVMEKVLQVLNELNDVVSLSVMDRMDANNYNWVPAEISCVNAIITSKNQADLHFRKEEFKLAAAGYAATLKLDTEAIRWSSILHSNKAAALMSLGNYSEAVVECHEAIAGDANNPKPYLRRARAYAALKQYTNSVRDYRTYLVSDPPPPDLNEIQIEYEGVLKDQKKQLPANTERREAHGANQRKYVRVKRQSSTSSSFESRPEEETSTTSSQSPFNG